jgi:hypothetical protein
MVEMAMQKRNPAMYGLIEEEGKEKRRNLIL